jgi:3',5'-cyclic AMP phosphodiesterase CpdA
MDYAAIIEELRGILVDSKDEEALVRYFLAINHENLDSRRRWQAHSRWRRWKAHW